MPDAATEANDPLDDLVDVEITGEGSTLAIVDAFPVIPAGADAAEATATIYDFQASVKAGYPVAISNFVDETTNALADAVNDGIVPPAQAGNFWLWMAGIAGATLIPAATAYAYVQGYIVKWAQGNGWATMGPNPVPTPAAQSATQSGTSAPPLPGAVTPPAILPSPTVGQTAVAKGAREIVPSVIPSSALTPGQAAEVQAAIGVASVDVLKVHAAVNDFMLGVLAPGQVPEALNQQNTAINALEHQMSQVRNGQWPRGFIGLQEAVGGALQALNGLSQEVGILANDVAMKAESTIGDVVDATAVEVETLSTAITSIVGTDIPDLANGLGTLTGEVGALRNTVTNQVLPELDAQGEALKAAAAKLALTDDACLEALCDAEDSVTTPIKNGGATPGLLKNLGGLLTKALEIGALMSLVEGLVTLANTKIAVNAIISDTETITGWAVKAAGVIETDFDLSGWD
jgi:hypothetical protein